MLGLRLNFPLGESWSNENFVVNDSSGLALNLQNVIADKRHDNFPLVVESQKYRLYRL
jgi:hypothetical protein